MSFDTSPQPLRDSLLDQQPTPEELHLQRERRRRLEDLLYQHLPEPQAIVMVALFMVDMHEADAAAHLGIQVKTLRQRKNLALAKLRTVPGLYDILKGKS